MCTNWYCSTIEMDLDHAHQIKQKSGSNRVNLRSERDVCTGNTLDTELSAREHEMMWNILWIRKLQKKNDFLFSLRAQYSIGTLEIYFQRIKSSFKITIQLQKKSSPTLKCIKLIISPHCKAHCLRKIYHAQNIAGRRSQ